jgi:acyl-CoA synthetase (AMP-forming)/AMP-acid ligase II
LAAFYSERLVDYQRPRRVVFLSTLPRNAMGKLQRNQVCELLKALV